MLRAKKEIRKQVSAMMQRFISLAIANGLNMTGTEKKKDFSVSEIYSVMKEVGQLESIPVKNLNTTVAYYLRSHSNSKNELAKWNEE